MEPPPAPTRNHIELPSLDDQLQVEDTDNTLETEDSDAIFEDPDSQDIDDTEINTNTTRRELNGYDLYQTLDVLKNYLSSVLLAPNNTAIETLELLGDVRAQCKEAGITFRWLVTQPIPGLAANVLQTENPQVANHLKVTTPRKEKLIVLDDEIMEVEYADQTEPEELEQMITPLTYEIIRCDWQSRSELLYFLLDHQYTHDIDNIIRKACLKRHRPDTNALFNHIIRRVALQEQERLRKEYGEGLEVATREDLTSAGGSGVEGEGVDDGDGGMDDEHPVKQGLMDYEIVLDENRFGFGTGDVEYESEKKRGKRREDWIPPNFQGQTLEQEKGLPKGFSGTFSIRDFWQAIRRVQASGKRKRDYKALYPRTKPKSPHKQHSDVDDVEEDPDTITLEFIACRRAWSLAIGQNSLRLSFLDADTLVDGAKNLKPISVDAKVTLISKFVPPAQTHRGIMNSDDEDDEDMTLSHVPKPKPKSKHNPLSFTFPQTTLRPSSSFPQYDDDETNEEDSTISDCDSLSLAFVDRNDPSDLADKIRNIPSSIYIPRCFPEPNPALHGHGQRMPDGLDDLRLLNERDELLFELQVGLKEVDVDLSAGSGWDESA